jgi:hypothetical protein
MALPIAGGVFATESSPPPRLEPIAVVDESAQTESAIIEVAPMVPEPPSPPPPTLRGRTKTHAAAHAGGPKARTPRDGRPLAPK